MKNGVLCLWILLSFVACNNLQNVDNKLFDLSKYRKFLDSNKTFDPSSQIHKDSSFTILYHRNLDSISKLKALELLKQVFQDSSDYYEKGIPFSGSFSFYFNSLIFETADYCGITVDRVTADCWSTHYLTFFLVYKKGKLIALENVAETWPYWTGESSFKTKSKVINDNNFLVEMVKLRRKNEDDYRSEYAYIDTLTRLVTFGLNGQLETTTIYEATKPFKKYHVLKLRNPLTGHLEIRKLYFYKDGNN